MASNLERSRGVERQFLMSVSHDLRTPMSSIQGYAEALTDQAIDPILLWRGDPRRVTPPRPARHQPLLLARLDARAFTFDVRTVDVVPVAEAMVASVAPRAVERGGAAPDAPTGPHAGPGRRRPCR